MLKAQCTGTEVASALGIHPDTLYSAVKRKFKSDFSAYAQQKKEAGKTALRQAQHELALSGNTSMLIWLGKQYLEQKDKSESDNREDLTLTIKREVKAKDGT